MSAGGGTTGAGAGVRFFNTFEPVTGLYRELIPRLAAEGVPVTVFVSRAVYRPGRGLEDFLERVPGTRLRRVASFGLHARQGTAAKAVIGALYFAGALALTLFARGRHRNVFLTQPPFIPLLGLILSKLRRQPYCVILMDLQPHLAAAVGLVGTGSLAYRAFRRLNLAALAGADRVVVIGRCMAETARAEGIPAARIRMIPNWADPEQIRPIPHARNDFRRAMGWGDRFVVMYAGTLGYAQSMEGLVAAAEKLTGQPGLVVAIIGEGSRRRALERRLETAGTTNVELHPFMHREFAIAEILSAADVHFVSLHPDVTGLAVPSKTYGVLAAGRPFLFQGSERSEIARLAREEDVGVVLPPGDSDLVAEAIRRLRGDPERMRAMGRRARALAEERWREEGPAVSYAAVLDEIDRTARVSGERR